MSLIFLTYTKTVFIEALKKTFDQEYITPDFRNLWVSMEYPAAEANYPGVWIDFTPTADLQIAGIAHVEWSEPGVTGERRKITRWRFAGMVTFTLVAMTSLERDRLADEITRVMAFGMEDPATSEFRAHIEGNDLIGLQVQWDKFSLSGNAETPGTPWGTDDVVYEITVSVDCQGEFLSDGSMRTFLPFSSFEIYNKIEGEPTFAPAEPAPDTPESSGDDWI